MPTGSVRLLILAALATLLAACTTLGDLQTPKVEVLTVQVLSADVFAQRFKVRVRVENPNDLELPVKGLEYKILMMGDSFAEGSSTEAFLLPALGSADFDMLVTTNFMSSFARLKSRVGGGKLEGIDYEIAGKISIDKGMVRKVPFNHRGTVDFTKALK